LARKILLADDSVTAQNMGRRILTDAGYEVITVNNGSAALKKIAEQLPELIVLDVYMPGYSGLEVCQRLKETRETARIPVLLTVGKLEPFKPEDARRARADAFIVKPFEASELLTALTKLEDKIVPQPAVKSGQFAKAWSELEQGSSASPNKGEKFGDAETGWKNRLIIPTPGAKAAEPEPEEEVSAKGKSSKGKKDKPKEEIKPLEVKAPGETSAVGVPADITPEEVAAIAAAAAAFEEKNQPPAEFAVKKSEVPEEPAPVTASIQPEKIEAKPVEAQAKESAPAQAAPETPKPVEPVVEVKLSEPVPAAKDIVPEVAVAEVKATPVESAPAIVASTDTSAPSVAEKSVDPAPAPAVAATPAIPKWIAQEVPLPPAEVGISLEQEMQKANAVLQAATAMVDLSAMANVEPPRHAPVETVAEVSVPSVETKIETKIEEAVSLTPAPEPERPQEPAAAASKPEAEPEVVTAVAAAASAGTSAPEASKPEAVSQLVSTPIPSETVPSVPETKANESELAAAWAQWKEIRETVVGSQLTSQIADVAAAGLKEAQPDNSFTSTPEAEETSSAGNPTAIASIVDTVLAELKPKLMEEIARKLGDDNKKKKK
jgi:CheY-like chemotaxis protein